MNWEATRKVVATQRTRLTQSIVVLRHLVADSWPFLVLAVKSGTCGYAFLFIFHMILTSRKVAGSIPVGVTGIFHWHNPSGRTVVLGLTQRLSEMSTRNNSWGVKAAGAKGWQPYHLRVPIVLKSGSFNLLEPLGPVQACNGISFVVLTIASHYFLIQHLPASLLMHHTVFSVSYELNLCPIYIYIYIYIYLYV